MPDPTIDIPTPTGGDGDDNTTTRGVNEMPEPQATGAQLPVEDYMRYKGGMYATLEVAQQGFVHAMEAMRLNYHEGKVGFRESQAIQGVKESGSGWARQGVPQGPTGG